MTRLFSVLGDSISTFEGYIPDGFNVFYNQEKQALTGVTCVEDTWWMQVIRHFDGKLLKNASWSGSMVEGAGYPAAWSRERIDALSTTEKCPDDILVFIGINDYGWGGSRNQASARSAAMPPCTDLSMIPPSVAGAPQNTALNDFANAYARMLGSIKENNPGATIWCISLLPGRLVDSEKSTHAWSLRGIPMDEYNAAICKAAEAAAANYVDAVSYGYDYDALDGTHPTRLGMSQIASQVIAGMEGAEKPELDSFGSDGKWLSEKFCNLPSCIGCPWARGTGNSWYCVCEKRVSER